MSEGWARCGQCSEVFDASSNLVSDVPPSSSQTEPAPLVQKAVERNAAAQEAAALSAALKEIVASRAARGDDPEPNNTVEVGKAAQPAEPAVKPMLIDTPEKPAASFLRESSKKKSVWHKTTVRVALTLLGVCLLTALTVQIALHERDRLATVFPGTKPFLQNLCGRFGCSVSTLRQIESLVVESSTFSRVRNDTYRLSLVIKNTAPFELAMPALELTLTDAQDQALTRRVLLASDLGGGAAAVAGGSEWAGTITLGARVSGGSERIVGYRVLVFYP